MIDSHCHLADKAFASDLTVVIDRAVAAGVDRMICIGDDMEESKKCIDLATTYPQLFATVGIHPHNAKEWREGTGERVIMLATSSPKVRAIGEIGLDYHYEFSPIDTQRQVFVSQLALARSLNLPCVVHCREAVEDVWAIVREYADIRIVLHCCTETWDDAEQFVATGHFLSFTGIATYSSADIIRDTIKHCPLEQMMIETDSPYLAPIPHRGKRNEPAHVIEVARCIAEVKGIELEEVDTITTKNALAFFGLPS